MLIINCLKSGHNETYPELPPKNRHELFEMFFSEWKQYVTEAHQTMFTIKPKNCKQ